MTSNDQTTSQSESKNRTRVEIIEATMEHYLSCYCDSLDKQPLAEYVYKLRALLAEIKAAPEYDRHSE